MKKALIIACTLILCVSFVYAQKTENIKVTGAEYAEFIAKNQYKFPVYTKAKIALRNGQMASARINYDNFTQMMKYIDEKGDTLEIANADDIDHISVGADTIFYADGNYYQWVASSATARLAVKYNYKEGPRALVGAFGTSSPAKNLQSRDRIMNDLSATAQHLSPDEVVTFTKETVYYISPIKGKWNYFVQATKKNIDDLFPKKKVGDFIKENRLNLNKEEDLIDLMVYISKPKQ